MDMGGHLDHVNDCKHSIDFFVPLTQRQVSVVSIQSTVWAFSHKNALRGKFNLVEKMVKVLPGSSLEKLCMAPNPQCCIPCSKVSEKIFKGFSRPSWSQDHDHLNKLGVVYRVQKSSVCWFPKRRFLKNFYHIWAWWPSWSHDYDDLNILLFFQHSRWSLASMGPVALHQKVFENINLSDLGHLGHMTRTFCSPILLSLHMKFGFDWPDGFWEEDVWRVWTMDGQATEPADTISSPISLKAQVS